jgi:hypothetical protein
MLMLGAFMKCGWGRKGVLISLGNKRNVSESSRIDVCELSLTEMYV